MGYHTNISCWCDSEKCWRDPIITHILSDAHLREVCGSCQQNTENSVIGTNIY